MGQVSARRAGISRFESFGRSEFSPFRLRQRVLTVADDFAAVRHAVRAKCPSAPGVYGVIDRAGRLVYVGMSTALRKRLVTYFQGGSTIRKEQCIAAHAARLVWEVAGHEFPARLRELELIRRHQPRFNVKGRQPERPLGFIYLSREDAPRFRVARRVPKAVRYCWGPLAISWRIREAVELVNRLFKLPDCPASISMHFAEQGHLFPLDLRMQCLRGETGSCLGPCAGHCTFAQYAEKLRAARAFLDGRDATSLAQLEHTLGDAANGQQYERAAQLRDTLERLRYLYEQLAILREPPLPDEFVYPVQAGRRQIWYLVVASRVVSAVPCPASSDVSARCLRRLTSAFTNARPKQNQLDRTATQIVSSWFRSHPAEAQLIQAPAEAIQFCQRLLAG
jgi:excinuclease ABC subunit C